MLLRIVPFVAVLLTLIAALSAGLVTLQDNSGLHGPGHVAEEAS